MPSHGTFATLCAELLRSGRRVRFRASGASMAPVLRDGDVVTVAPVRPEDVAPGDVLLYAAPRGLTAHRVTGRLPDGAGFRARGDAPGSDEEHVAPDQVLGRLDAPLDRGAGPALTSRLRRLLRRAVSLVRRAAALRGRSAR